MTRTAEHRWLSRYAWLTAFSTLVLICVGGVVTSRGAGMAVPDWPNTYGYNMFFFPFSKWVGNIFYEHSHRLVASAVGLMTVILAVWLGLRESRRWVRWLGLLAVVAVVFQGVLGGLRVILFKDELGIFHATLAQVFLCLICAIALVTGSWWSRSRSLHSPVPDDHSIRRVFPLVVGLVVFQLILGATMRHQHAGLAISDFPKAHGKWWPDMDAGSIAKYNRERPEVGALNPITASQVGLQMVHRIAAVMVLLGVVACAVAARRQFGRGHPLSRMAWVWLGLVGVQAVLGAATVLTGKSADIATAHVAVGAACLALGVLSTIIAFRITEPRRAAAREEQTNRAVAGASLLAGTGSR